MEHLLEHIPYFQDKVLLRGYIFGVLLIHSSKDYHGRKKTIQERKKNSSYK